MNKVFEVLLHQDFVFISEAHCTKGKVQAIEHRLDMMGYESFWSHGGKGGGRGKGGGKGGGKGKGAGKGKGGKGKGGKGSSGRSAFA